MSKHKYSSNKQKGSRKAKSVNKTYFRTGVVKRSRVYP